MNIRYPLREVEWLSKTRRLPFVAFVEEALPPDLCDAIVARIDAEAPALATINVPGGPVVDTRVRNNERVIFDDVALAADLFARTREFLPAQADGGTLVGYNERFRGQVIDKKGRVLPAAIEGACRVLAATGTRPRLDPRLVRLLTEVSDAFGGRAVRVVSGYRTTSFFQDSRHKLSKAVDFSIPGVPNQVLRDYLRTLKNVGVGYYPNSSFVHLDVREYSAYWVDYAGPGESPRGKRHMPQSPEDVHEEEPEDAPDGDAQRPMVRAGLPSADSQLSSETTPRDVAEKPQATNPAPLSRALPDLAP